MDGLSKDEVDELLERLRVAVARTPLTGAELQPVGPITISLGVASAADGVASFDALVSMADAALYESKSRGRNCLTHWSDMQDKATDQDAA